MLDCGLEKYQNAVLCGSFLDAISVEDGVSKPTCDVFMRLLNTDDNVSVEGLNENPSTEDIVAFAQESYGVSLAGYIGAVIAAVSVPLKALSVSEKYLVDITQMTIRSVGSSTGTYEGTLTEDQAKLLVRGVEAAAGIALLYYTGIGSAVVQAAKSPQNVKTFIGGFITKLSEFKWPFGSVKSGWKSVRSAFIAFKRNVASDVHSKVKWGAKPAVTFMSKAVRAISSAIGRIARGVSSGLSRFAQSVNEIIVTPAFVDPVVKSVRTYMQSKRISSVLIAQAVRMLGSFGIMMIMRFVFSLIKQSVGLLVDFCKKITNSGPGPEKHFH